MRITNSSVFIPYLTNLQNLENQKFKSDLQISTGTQLINIADNTQMLYDTKQIQTLMTNNNQYINNLETALSEIRMASDQFDSISLKMQNIQQLAIDSMNVGNHSNLATLGINLKGLLNDVIRDANLNYNGKYLFSGTKTTADSLNKTPDAQGEQPYELVQGTATADNPSGLKIIFKGNQESRTINKDKYTSEAYNTKSEDIFGVGGTEVFENVLKLYNLLTYKEDGTVRKETDLFSKVDFEKVNVYQRTIAVINDKIAKTGGINGALMNRFETLQSQLKEENTRMGELLSIKSDTDVAKTSIDLKKQESSLQYSLQIGAQMMQNSLFDFLK
ncbi:MAG: hypothetical protein NT007_15585 [Candidatus Kapabacteria bacterium]|nr:hypothetical protein [Candidatus Kapabacteria bacterium]